jgi:drug/metabolite transporter (DMT)-like permease
MSERFSARNPLWPGVPLALASALLFGASTPFAKLLVETSNPQLVAGLLYLGAGVGLMIGQATRFILGVRSSEAPLRRADAPG